MRDFGCPETIVFVMSDHGFGPAKKIVFPNRLLAEWGFLAPGGPGAADPLASDPNYAPSKIGFDPRRTRAFMGPALVGPFAEIFINAKSRFAVGIVERGTDYERVRDGIAARFLEWRDPLTGFRPAVAAHKREELYSGPFAAATPDLLIEFADCRTMAEVADYPAIVDAVPWHVPTKAQTGTHTRDGIFFAAGPGVRAGAEFGRFSIADVAPTVLCALDLPVPEGLDGRTLEEIFTPERLSARPARSEPARGGGAIADQQSDPDETERMTRILEGLGYFT
jgi:predicted AlkP superfamily phosphohydrolase/phosphomutase